MIDAMLMLAAVTLAQAPAPMLCADAATAEAVVTSHGLARVAVAWRAGDRFELWSDGVHWVVMRTPAERPDLRCVEDEGDGERPVWARPISVPRPWGAQ